jgi:hypothetical protein
MANCRQGPGGRRSGRPGTYIVTRPSPVNAVVMPMLELIEDGDASSHLSASERDRAVLLQLRQTFNCETNELVG